MDISPAGLDVIREREGCRLTAYKDSRGIWTIGVGHTPARPGQTITQTEADTLLHEDLAPIVKELNDIGIVKYQCELDALGSLIFNIGLGAFRGSTVRRMLVARNMHAAGRAILMWNEPPEIRPRREAEFVEFTYGEYVARIEERVA